MHTQNQPTTGHLNHRLFVAFPLFAIIAAVSIVAGISNTRGQLMTDGDIITNEEPQNVVIPGGVVRMEPFGYGYTEAGTFHMVEGSALIAASDMLTMRVGEISVSAFDGVLHVSASSGSIALSAMTTPLLAKQGSGILVIPAMMQWAATDIPSAEDMGSWLAQRAVMDLPEHFLIDMLPRADELMASIDQSATVMPPEFLFSPAFFLDSLQFESAQERALQYQLVSLLLALERALRDNDALAYEALLMTDATDQAMASAQGYAMLPRLLSLAGHVGKEALLLPYFTRDHDRWLLAAFHPQIRNYALALGIPEGIDREHLLNMLMLLPVSDTMGDPIEPLAANTWQTAWDGYLATTEFPADVIGQAMPVVRDSIVRFEQKKQPERLNRYRKMVQAFVQPYDMFVWQETRDILSQMQAMDVQIAMDEIVGDVAPVESVEVVEFNAEELKQQTMARLMEFGSMFTIATSIEAVAPDRVEVTDVVFATNNGDTLLTFVYNPQADTAGEIVYQGQVLPYSMPIENYLGWVRGL